MNNQNFSRLIMNKFILNIGVFLLFFGCSNQTETVFNIENPEITGIDFINTLVDTEDQNILDYLYYYNGGGVAIGDINNDGLQDIFFTANQLKNKLYLNKGDLKFEDISESANILGQSDWNTGVSMVDINNDGYLDIYVCAVVGINGFQGHNELYINNKDNTFTESSSEYHLDFENYSSSAAFFDYDLDGDLDMYLLNHAIHTQDSFGKAEIRNNRNDESGDKLLRNDNGIFTDVSAEAGIFSGVNGYGLGIAVSDFNLDGYPDLYVSNDFHEDDYYYLNNGNGAFKETLKENFGHTSRFSMGSDVADIDNDGDFDLMTLDMLPDDEFVLKSSAGDDNVQMLEMRTQKLGYHYQYTRNMLQVNQPDGQFIETALLSNVAATDWSWSVLFADYNLDGNTDFFVSNGIPKRPNDLDYINYISNEKIKNKLNATTLVDNEAFNAMPEGKVVNSFFKGTSSLKFEDETGIWVKDKPSFSNGSAYGDLDNDGDLELVTNNINEVATLYNNITNDKGDYLKIQFEYNATNKFGIGTKCMVYTNGSKQYKELFPYRGFQSSSQPSLHFGFKKNTVIDSLIVIWPNKTSETIIAPKTNQLLDVKYKLSNSNFDYNSLKYNTAPVFLKVENGLGLNYKHTENKNIDFNRQKLIPYKTSDRGPVMAIGDINNDDKDDIFISGTKYSPSLIYLQKDSTFVSKIYNTISFDSISEDTSIHINDINGDKINDIIVSSGGGEYFGNKEALENRLYIAKDSTYIKQQIQNEFNDTDIIKPFDMDNDGDLDIFVGNATVAMDFGNIPNSYILKNNNGSFELFSTFIDLGMVRDVEVTDFNNDGKQDIIVVGEWMQPTFLQNNTSAFIDSTSNYLKQSLNGLWRTIISYDIDNDGDLDYLLGNWGTNTKFKASEEFPMLMFYDDFDNNSKTETILATEKKGKYYPINGLDELSSQLVSLTKKKFTNYKDFAGKTIYEIFDKSLLDHAKQFKVHTLQSGYLKNENGAFNFIPFKDELQVAPINCFTPIMIKQQNGILCGGNYFGVTPYHGRFDSFPGAFIISENNIILGNQLGLNFFQNVITQLEVVTLNNQKWLIALVNNQHIQTYKFD